jgi:hypothetical protein
LGVNNPHHERQEAAEMSVGNLTDLGKGASDGSLKVSHPIQLAERLKEMSTRLRDLAVSGASRGDSFDQVERSVWDAVRRLGFEAMELFLALQGDGDLGEQVTTDEQTLTRSEQPVTTTVRSIFGEHRFPEYTYSRGAKKKIELRSLSARMQLPEHRWSYQLQEFSQMFCIGESFSTAATNLETVFGQPFSIDTLEQVNRRMGMDAGEYLTQLPKPRKQEEGELLVATADGKGVPLVKEDTPMVAAFETRKKRPGNRRMATVAGAYTVDRYPRTPESIVRGLFRDAWDRDDDDAPKRPKPRHKQLSAHFPTPFHDDDEELTISGIHEGMTWLAGQVAQRRQPGQTLLVMLDGQISLWDVAEVHFGDDPDVVWILDIIHVAGYVWEASSLLTSTQADREAFTRDRLLRILQGDVCGVIRGLRRMGSLAQLKGEKLADFQRICSYFERHQARMKYDEYLAAGYPIATGVIEGACGHLVKDRMERSGMRWTLEGARAMLDVRAVFQSDYWSQFCQHRIAKQTSRIHPHRKIIGDYQPLQLAC